MCGILCSLCLSQNKTKTLSDDDIQFLEETKILLKNRGPDISSEHRIECDDFVANFSGFVLWQQGVKPTKQPLVHQDQVLLFNGDIFSTVSLEPKSTLESDTDWLFSNILQCHDELEFMELVKQLRGPYSLIYYNNAMKRLYFMRDSLGRQTLLIGAYKNYIYITSVASRGFGGSSFIEVPPIGVFCLNLNDGDIKVALNTWQDFSAHQHFTNQLQTLEEVLKLKVVVKDMLEPYWMRTEDSTSLGYNFQTLLSDSCSESALNIVTKTLQNKEVLSTCDELIELLKISMKERVEATPLLCKNCIKLVPNEQYCMHPKIGILFSGGVDCSILAVLADTFVDKNNDIDLINVSFEKIVRGKLTSIPDYNTPDRLTSRQTYKELIKLCPERKWNLVEVNVTREELKYALRHRISDLCFPLNTILDESLGAALWFAASSKGEVNGLRYESPCRVLLIGSGADELFGGYTRHRNAFLRSGLSWTNLDNELHLDWIRLPNRNLARDDRIIGDNGVTARSPYLEENVTFFVRNLKSSEKCFHGLPEGIGDKLLLRLCAFRLGLRDACWLKKRALQFGSRVADRKQNAKDISVALKQ